MGFSPIRYVTVIFQKGNTTSYMRYLFPLAVQTVRRPFGPKYPTNPQTIGNHILKRRMELGLFQKDVARIIHVSMDCIRLWETGKSEPQVQHAPKIIQFLGYNPYIIETNTLGGKIKDYRYRHGLSHKKIGQLVGVDASTIGSWESGKFPPDKPNLSKINILLANARLIPKNS